MSFFVMPFGGSAQEAGETNRAELNQRPECSSTSAAATAAAAKAFGGVREDAVPVLPIVARTVTIEYRGKLRSPTQP